MPSKLDTPAQFDENKLHTTTDAAQNKKAFMNNFGIKFLLPSVYVLDAKIWTKFEGYFL